MFVLVKRFSFYFILTLVVSLSLFPALGEGGLKEDFDKLICAYLNPFLGGINSALLNKTEKCHPRIGRYIIKDNKLYVRGAECRAISSLLLYLLEEEGLPDLDFLYLNESFANQEFKGPVFCQSKLPGLKSAIPFHDRMCSVGNVAKHPHNDWEEIFNTLMTFQLPWEQRLDQLIWRGGGNDRGNNYRSDILKGPRGILCYLSVRYPHLINAKFAHWKDIPPIQCDLIYKGSPLLIEEQIQYKFQIILHGAVGTFPGARWRLLSGSTCFFVDPQRLTFWYLPLLKPNVHYIPILSSHLITLPSLIEKLLNAEHLLAKEIAHNSFHFASEYLSPASIILFCRMMLEKYAKLYSGKVPSLDGFMHRQNLENTPLYF